MSVATTILFREIARSDALEANIREHVDRLGKASSDIRSCKVVVATDGRRHHQGVVYRIKIHLKLGKQETHAGASRAHDSRHIDPYVAVADAFDAIRRRIDDYAQQEDTKRRRSLPPMRKTTVTGG